MFLKASGENFLSITGMHIHFRSVLFINIAYSGGVNTCWNPNFYFVVLNQFCDSWLKNSDGLFCFVKSGNTKIVSSENKTLTSPSLVLTYSRDN